MIISAQALHLRQSRGEHFLLIDVRDAAEWQQATIPGALHCNVYDYFIADSTEAGLALMAAEAATALEPLLASYPGATPVFFESQVGMRSPRGAWFAWLLGHEDALILDGGIEAWREAGFATAAGQGLSRTIAHQSVAEAPFWNRDLVCTRQQVEEADGVAVINVDARRPSEFDGSFAHDCCPRAGRIPHSTLLFWEDVVAGGHFLPPEEIRQRALVAGLREEAKLQVYCHRGARAATVLAALKRAGFNDVSVYVGSWHEWAEHPELPLLRGS
ncbi:sulfurtransferase [Erwinia sp. JUb26]|uniref:sulfurtransferase n=1 Tax=Erwinia sp. JUb26 TaxID=2485126 RepID=UPI000F4837C7|nr:rhodanese-like domain-containing protein [Erwinia sp. JUb26]ROR09956.1 thiosulfate/3-mercaptopyruvate sulfurtransferase [Erwinia sp. JUb26]